ncbi:hypothetical protein [Thorsellia anophelis]|uniref:DUF3298 domain-containing protein n=1 Tax=Thorsellia anophelis DSM 18579 TaxID=1123402 RepID=A0A1I0F1W2_9GAMM|nr:hypothetical protein [Thorsellia anophelis]SET51866.1 hypothetical protein SAMN02583745_02606 [Thorsellia anophelis DSM 18579]
MIFFKKRLWFFLIPLYLATVVKSQAEEDPINVYEGTIKTYPIVIQFSQSDYGVSGSYFYKKQSRDIPLEGRLIEGQLYFEEGEADSGQGMVLNLFNEPIDGKWFNLNKDTELPIAITPVTSVDVSNETSNALKKIAENDLYEYLRHKTLPLTKDKSTQFMEQSIQWYIEPKSAKKLFTINSDSYNSLNTNLEFYFRSYLSLAFRCSDVDFVMTPTYLTNDITSFEITGNYYCPEMPHPNIIHQNFNFHNKSGKLLNLSDVLSLPNPEYKNDWILEQLLERYPDKMNDSECPYLEADSWNISEENDWVITEQGIKLNPQFPHVLAACGGPDWAILPFELIAQHPSLISIPSAGAKKTSN